MNKLAVIAAMILLFFPSLSCAAGKTENGNVPSEKKELPPKVTETKEICRKPILSGTWYPGNKEELSKTIDKYLEQADPEPSEGKLLALISPHAGYTYSGQTAAYALKTFDRIYKRVEEIGPSDRVLM